MGRNFLKNMNLVGQKFGLGTVVRKTGHTRTIGKKNKRTFDEWELKCDCGQIYYTTTQHLIGERTKSCGCIRYVNLIGKRFGKAIVIAQAGHGTKGTNSKRSTVKWRLKCDCGIEFESISEYLNNGDTTSCGCKRKNFHNSGERSKDLNLNKYIRKLRDGAIVRGHFFDESVDAKALQGLMSIQGFKCSISGVSLDWKNCSLDRKDSSKGYTLENIQWVHRVINYMKNTLDQQEFIDWCKKVAESNS